LPRAVVTGGGRGIGADTARVLAADGWDVVVAARSQDQIDGVAAEIGGRAVQMDVADRESVDRGFDEIGSIDLLFANAGVASATSTTSGARSR
jgi:NADP-dependent 3-hydroxy acid dehydrogenase YdfG